MAQNPLRTKAGRAEAAAQLHSKRLQALRYHPTLAALSEQELDWIIATVIAPDHRIGWFERAGEIAVTEMQQMVADRPPAAKD